MSTNNFFNYGDKRYKLDDPVEDMEKTYVSHETIGEGESALSLTETLANRQPVQRTTKPLMKALSKRI